MMGLLATLALGPLLGIPRTVNAVAPKQMQSILG